MMQLRSVARHPWRLTWLLLLIVALVVAVSATLVNRSDGKKPSNVLGESLTQASPSTSVQAVSGAGSGSTNGSAVNPNGNNGNGNSNPGHPITVTGTSPTGLGPGVTKTITVTVTNPNNQDIRVTAVTIGVGNASKLCPAAGNISVTSYSSTAPGAATYIAPKNSRVQIPLSITMLDTPVNQDSCKSVSFPLTFTATGQQA